jgi:hypothetical protein
MRHYITICCCFFEHLDSFKCSNYQSCWCFGWYRNDFILSSSCSLFFIEQMNQKCFLNKNEFFWGNENVSFFNTKNLHTKKRRLLLYTKEILLLQTKKHFLFFKKMIISYITQNRLFFIQKLLSLSFSKNRFFTIHVIRQFQPEVNVFPVFISYNKFLNYWTFIDIMTHTNLNR